ncbi:MAG: hypothetical protein BWX92_01669 [Deltaproteobacteria bacterium ADurb.Bin135]|nr:MAG: hypothetical protein BWX92_01669 [Deltaproteobacteria bacterium ADurb.Bin135]
MKQRIITIFYLVIALCLVFIADLHAPEITERDIFGYVAYRVAEGGTILDGDGAVRGWILGDTVYDPSWDVRYVIPGEDKEG